MAKTTPRRQCTAKSKQSGERCKRPPIPGGTVCKIHGGGTPAVKDAARRRLQALAEPAMVQLGQILRDWNASDSAKVRAALGILDRCGYGPTSKHEVTGAEGEPLRRIELVVVDPKDPDG